jgi:hypothetical protein
MELLFTTAHILFALQAGQATVAGSVRDEETGEPLVGAVVALPDLERATATDAGGRYVLLDVPAGPQHITVRFIGHAQRALHALVPSDGRLEINVSLQAEPLRLGTIEVHTPLHIRGFEGHDSTAPYDRSSSIAAVRNHPLLSEPDVLQALEGGPVVISPESPSGVHVRGGASDQTGYLLDGVPVFSPYHAAGQFSAWNPDAVSGVYLSSSVPLPGHSDALAGTITATTRTPGTRLETQGSISTSQARMTFDGTIGRTGVGYLLSMRSRIAGMPLVDHDPSYLRGESGDLLAKVQAPALGGRARLLAYDSENEIDAASEANPVASTSARNNFEWSSRSYGAEWNGTIAGAKVTLLGWSASTGASSSWAGPAARMRLGSGRRDLGLLGTVEVRSRKGRTTTGISIERSRTTYEVRPDSGSGSFTLRASTPVAAVFAQSTRAVLPRVVATLGASLAAADAGPYFGPYAQLRWKASERLTLTGSYARTHQFAQSLRNAESVVGNVFPAHLYIGAGAPGVPTARSDGVVLAAEYFPFAGVRLELEAYRRSTEGLLLVAPRDGGPFTTGGFAIGSGRSGGLSLDAALSRARYGVLASYGLQQVRLRYGESGYVPDHGTTHLLQAGLVVFPTATWSIKVGATSAFGRRTTSLSSGLEWEACNLLDQGCEFAGSPQYSGSDALGATALPAYVRLDLGIRKHWHLALGGRDAMVALFATATNLLSRTNVLTYTTDPVTGQSRRVEMRPLAPLVVGLDWRF